MRERETEGRETGKKGDGRWGKWVREEAKQELRIWQRWSAEKEAEPGSTGSVVPTRRRGTGRCRCRCRCTVREIDATGEGVQAGEMGEMRIGLAWETTIIATTPACLPALFEWYVCFWQLNHLIVIDRTHLGRDVMHCIQRRAVPNLLLQEGDVVAAVQRTIEGPPNKNRRRPLLSLR